MLVLGDEPKTRYPPYVTWGLIVANIAIAIYTWYFTDFEWVVYTFGFIPARLLNPAYLYTLVTHMFLHGGWEHLLGNMLYLYVFGDNVESRMGHGKFLLFYILSGVYGALIHAAIAATIPPYAVSPVLGGAVHPMTIPVIGASGAISGVLGAYLILYPSARLKLLAFIGIFPVVFEVPAAYFIMFWFLMQLYMGMLTLAYGAFLGVAFWAHIGGFIAGILLTYALRTKIVRRRRVLIEEEYFVEVPVY